MDVGAKEVGKDVDTGERRYPWPLFWILLAAGIVGNLAVIPLALSLKAEQGGPIQYSLATIAFHQFIQIGALLLAIGGGLALARKTGLGAPVLESWLSGKSIGADLKAMLPASILAGCAVGIAIPVLDMAFKPYIPVVQSSTPVETAAYQGLLAAFYGAINEELFMRLLCLSFFVWLLGGGWSRQQLQPGAFSLWSANILAALLFGIGHLPTAYAIMPHTAVVVLRVIILNAIGGIVFGYLYLKKGLESSITAHFFTDLISHVLLPLAGI